MKTYTRKRMKESLLNDIMIGLGLAATSEDSALPLEGAKIALHYALVFGLATVSEIKKAVGKAKPMTNVDLVKNMILLEDFKRANVRRAGHDILRIPRVSKNVSVGSSAQYGLLRRSANRHGRQDRRS